jgi:Flp pilus assembly protein TadD
MARTDPVTARYVRGMTHSLGAILFACVTIGSANAQNAVNREVVQPTQSAEVERLNVALRRLARDPQNVAALIEAGNSAIELDDLDAALGFFGRAQELSPGNPQAKVGLAVVYLRSRRPIESLRLFAEAEQAGANSDSVAGDRGLAYDLVGNNTQAQESYRIALARGPDDEIARRLALSLAISGDKPGFEEVLLPMLQRQDYGAFRIRAFGLAIMGEESEAVSIANAVMPRDLATRIAPYLAYMPRLTKAQQAAAANLGIFPRAADIGRDDLRIAQYASGAAETGSRLTPSGNPLGSRADSRRRPDQASSRVTGETGQSLSDAFEELAAQEAVAPDAAAGAVDISSIEAPREARPDPIIHPSRFWVQVATGRDISALGFDWRRIQRRHAALLGEFAPHVVKWGQANRLLAGPIASRDEARRLVNSLKRAGQDSFIYVSPQGQEIDNLQSLVINPN